MTAEAFWLIIENAGKKGNDDLDAIYDELWDQLCALEIPELMQWTLILEEYRNLAHTGKLWAAANVIQDGCTLSMFQSFLGGLISRGKTVYLDALRDTQTIADSGALNEDAFFEEIWHVGKSAYFQKMKIVQWDNARFWKELGRHTLDETLREQLRVEAETEDNAGILQNVGLSKKYAS